MKLDVFQYSNKGGRQRNEDSAEAVLAQEDALFVLADGLGGHCGGEEASRCVVDVFAREFEKERPMEGMEWLRGQTARANEALLTHSREKQGKRKSTLAALLISGESACWAHVGDSRIYLLKPLGIFPLTQDHSVTYKKYRAGEISKEEINFDEDRASLLRALGEDGRWGPDCAALPEGEKLCPGDAFLLCSDGFWEYLYEEEIWLDYLKSETAAEWGRRMLCRLMERFAQGSDNLTLLAVRVENAQKAEAFGGSGDAGEAAREESCRGAEKAARNWRTA